MSSRYQPPTYTPLMCRHYLESRAIPPQIVEWIADVGKIKRWTNVLDIGCGPGQLTMQLAKYSDFVVGVDISPDFIEIANKEASSSGSTARFVQTDANELTGFTGLVDIFVASQVMHWLDPAVSASKVCEVVRIGGYAFFVETKPSLSALHPLRRCFGFGDLAQTALFEEAQRQTIHYTDLFNRSNVAASASRMHYEDMFIYQEERVLGSDFALAYFFPMAIDSRISGTESVEMKIQRLFEACSPEECIGTINWVVTVFRRE